MVALALFAASCGGGTAAPEDAEPGWWAEISDTLEAPSFRGEVTAGLETSLASEPIVPPGCVEPVAAEVTEVLFTDLGEFGLRGLGVTPGDVSALESDRFFNALPAATKGTVTAAIAACDGVALALSPQIPGVSYASLDCLVDRLSTHAFFENGFMRPQLDDGSTLASAIFASAKAECLDTAEEQAYDSWSAQQMASPSRAVLAPVACVSIDPAPFAASLGFDIDGFTPSVIRSSDDRPVGCAYGDPDGQGPWVLLYVATQDFQRGLYEDYEPSIREVAEVWPDLTEVLDYAGVHYIANGGSVEWLDGAVTATFADGNTSAAVAAGDYLLMVSAGPGGGGIPLTRAHLADAVEVLAAALALS